MYCNGSACLSLPIDKVKAAGYKPLVNDGGSTTSEDTLRGNVTTAGHVTGDQTTSNLGTGGPKSSTIEVPNTNSGNTVEIVETTSQRKTRPKLFRQKSFEIDSDSTDTSLADISNIVSEVRIGFLSYL